MNVRLRASLLASLALVAAWQLGQGAWIPVKAAIGQAMLAKAWTSAEPGQPPSRPWPWADMRPIARLEVPRLQIDQLVLAGLTGHSLAWGPGLVGPRNDDPGAGHRIIAGHRDTHFRFLEHLHTGDTVTLTRHDGRSRHWQVTATAVIDSRVTRLDLSEPGPLLTLVTCWPFDATEAGGPERYIVTLEPAEPQLTGLTSDTRENPS